MIEIISETREGVDTIAVMPEDRGLKLPEGMVDKPVTKVGGAVIGEDKLDTLDGELELEVTVTSEVIAPWAKDTDVMFREGHPEDPVSRRTSGQA